MKNLGDTDSNDGQTGLMDISDQSEGKTEEPPYDWRPEDTPEKWETVEDLLGYNEEQFRRTPVGLIAEEESLHPAEVFIGSRTWNTEQETSDFGGHSVASETKAEPSDASLESEEYPEPPSRGEIKRFSRAITISASIMLLVSIYSVEQGVLNLVLGTASVLVLLVITVISYALQSNFNSDA